MINIGNELIAEFHEYTHPGTKKVGWQARPEGGQILVPKNKDRRQPGTKQGQYSSWRVRVLHQLRQVSGLTFWVVRLVAPVGEAHSAKPSVDRPVPRITLADLQRRPVEKSRVEEPKRPQTGRFVGDPIAAPPPGKEFKNVLSFPPKSPVLTSGRQKKPAGKKKPANKQASGKR